MRARAGLLMTLVLLTACGGALGDGGAPPTPTPRAVAVGAIATEAAPTGDPNATATRVSTATRMVAVTRSAIVATTRTATPAAPASPTRPLPIAGTPGTPIPVRPGPPGIPATPGIGTPGVAGTPGRGTPTTAGTPGRETPTTAATPVVGGTIVQLYAPYRPDGLVGGLGVAAEVQGYCWAGSESLHGRPDAWRCTSANRILDPCIESGSPDPAPLACAPSPWSDAVTLLTLTAPLPRDRANAANPNAAPLWAFQLANGAQCHALGGVTGTVAGLRINASCSDGTRTLGEPDRSASRWRIYVMRDNSPAIEQQEIAVVWR